MKIIDKLIRLAISISLTTAIVCPVLAGDYDEAMPAEPATLGDLQNNIPFPNFLEDITVLLFCKSLISFNNLMLYFSCYRDKDIENQFKPGYKENTDVELDSDVVEIEITANQSDFLENRYERAVGEGLGITTFEPARVFGRKVSVMINFSVLFRKRNGYEHITLFNNHFRNLKSLGSGYTAAQRIYESGPNNNCRRTYVPLWIEADVEVTGAAYNASLFETGLDENISIDTIDYCVNWDKKLIQESRFIPIVYRDQYVNGTYVEWFHTEALRSNNNYGRDIMGNYGGSGRAIRGSWSTLPGL